MADAHHDAARHDERRRREAELLGTEQRCDHDVATGLQLAVDLHDDPVAKPVSDECLLRLREPELPRDPGVLYRRERRRTRPAVVARR